MKIIPISLLLIFILANAHSQTTYQYQKIDNKKTTLDLNPNAKFLKYFPTNLILKAGLVIKELNTGRSTIEFIFFTPSNQQPMVNLNSIILKSTSEKTLVINNPVRDSVYNLSDGKLSWNTTHYLEKNQLDFIKQEKIKAIVLTVNGNLLELILKKSLKVL